MNTSSDPARCLPPAADGAARSAPDPSGVPRGAADPPPEERPIPSHFWWLKRIIAAVGVFILALVGLRLWWGYVAAQRLQALIAQYRAAGEPVLVKDFQPEPIPAQENAAYFIEKAVAAIPDVRFVEAAIYDPSLVTKDADAARQFLRQHERSLELLARSSPLARADWGFPLRSPLLAATPTPGWTSQRLLAKAAIVAARCHHVLANDAGAMTSVRDVLALAFRGTAVYPGPLSISVDTTVAALANAAIEGLVPTLRLWPRGIPRPCAQGPAECEVVQSLIRELLDDARWCENWRVAWRGERAAALDAALCLADGRMGLSGLFGIAPPGTAAWIPWVFDFSARLLLSPAWTIDAVRVSYFYSGYARGVDSLNYWAAPPPFPAGGGDFPGDQLTHCVLLITSRPPDGERERWFAVLAKRRMAAIALALRLYEFDNGCPPVVLSALVPEYLAAIPADPFDPEGGPLQYVPDGRLPLLYSVGLNGVDEGGVFAVEGDKVNEKFQDLPFFLRGQRPREPADPRITAAIMSADRQPPSTQAAEDNPDVQDEERDEQGE